MTALPDHGGRSSIRLDPDLAGMRDGAAAAFYGLCAVFSSAVIHAGFALPASSHVFERPTALRVQAPRVVPAMPYDIVRRIAPALDMQAGLALVRTCCGSRELGEIVVWQNVWITEHPGRVASKSVICE